VEEDRVTRVHHHMHSGCHFSRSYVHDSMVHLVHPPFPRRIAVRSQRKPVRSRNHREAPIAAVYPLKGSPSGCDAVRWPVGEIVEVLVKGVPTRTSPSIRWLVDDHGVDALNAWQKRRERRGREGRMMAQQNHTNATKRAGRTRPSEVSHDLHQLWMRHT
jgi:hypothetical protein